MIKGSQFNPEQFFHFASFILQNNSANEAELRSAISRAYYSIFLIARDRLFGPDEQQLSQVIKKRMIKKYQVKKRRKYLGMHERVIFAISEKRDNIILSQQLGQLRDARIRADYRVSQNCLSEVNKKSWREYAEESMQLATLMLARVKRLPSY